MTERFGFRVVPVHVGHDGLYKQWLRIPEHQNHWWFLVNHKLHCKDNTRMQNKSKNFEIYIKDISPVIKDGVTVCGVQHVLWARWPVLGVRVRPGNCQFPYKENPMRALNTTSLKCYLPSTDTINRRGKIYICVWRFKVASCKCASFKSTRFLQKLRSDTFLTV